MAAAAPKVRRSQNFSSCPAFPCERANRSLSRRRRPSGLDIDLDLYDLELERRRGAGLLLRGSVGLGLLYDFTEWRGVTDFLGQQQGAVFDQDDAWGGLLNLIPTRMHYADDDDGQSKKKAKKAKAKAAKAAKQAAAAADNDADPDTTMNDAVAEPTQPEKEKEKATKPQKEKPAKPQKETPAKPQKEKPAKPEKETPAKPQKGTPAKSPAQLEAKRKLEDWEVAALASTGSETPIKAEEQTPGPKKKKQRIETPSTDIKLARQLIGEAEEAAERAEKFGKDKAASAATPKSVKNHLRKMAHLASTATPKPPAPATKPAKSAKLTEATPALPDTSSRSTTSEPESSTFDAADAAVQPQIPSAATSVSSTAGPSDKPKPIKIPEDTAAFRERFAARLATLRAARRADGTDGKPARSRDELLEQRRYKAAQRKEHKKELRRLARLEEDRKREEALKANSPSVMSPGDELDENTANFSFGRVSFGDGAQLSHDLSYVLNRNGKKGPTDPKGQLLKLQGQKRRLAEMDEDKRRDVEEKEDWLTARRRAEGERVRDDEGLLRKAVKRKERTKRKSEKEWKERKSAVEVGMKARQKKREENIQKRKDDKKLGKLGKRKGSGGVTKSKKKNRPGFEGKFGGGKK